MKPFAILPNIFWVGALDYACRDFHGYSRSPQGSTYNAYLILDEHKTLVDTVKANSLEAMLRRVKEITDPTSIDYLIVQHVEMDHSGCLPQIVAATQPRKIFCSPMGKKALEAHFDTSNWPIEVKKTGDTLSLGQRTVHFVETRMLHWPDSMVSYVEQDKLLFSNDAFGQNIACSERFADEVDRGMLLHAMQEYYFNIVQPYSPLVLKVLEQIAALKLDIEMIAADHGLIFRGQDEVAFVLNTYRRFATPVWHKRAAIAYDSMWHSTEKLAYAIGEGLMEAGVPNRLLPLSVCHHSEVVTELAQCGALLVGSPTHNNGILPGVADLLTYVQGLKPQKKIGAAFGSYGWSGEAHRAIAERLGQMGFELPLEPLSCKYVPKDADLSRAHAFGVSLGQALAQHCAQQD